MSGFTPSMWLELVAGLLAAGWGVHGLLTTSKREARYDQRMAEHSAGTLAREPKVPAPPSTYLIGLVIGAFFLGRLALGLL